jgi:hypothetical protein
MMRPGFGKPGKFRNGSIRMGVHERSSEKVGGGLMTVFVPEGPMKG